MKRVFDFLRMLLILGLLAAGSAFLANYSSEDVAGNARVMDGDSLMVGSREIRLLGIDAPEYRQLCKAAAAGNAEYPCGKKAAAHLRRLVAGKKVTCSGNETDKYDRFLGLCEAGGKEINQAMVSDGWAVAFGDYEREEAEARRKGNGLWQGEFSLPSDWRRSRAEKLESNWLTKLFD